MQQLLAIQRSKTPYFSDQLKLALCRRRRYVAIYDNNASVRRQRSRAYRREWINMLASSTDRMAVIAAYFAETERLMKRLPEISDGVSRAADAWIDALSAGRKVIFCGNGGSAADAQHLAAELMGRFLFDRDPMPALSLTVDTSALTAIGNDYGYENVFSRQLRGIGQAGDVLVGMSTSGNSRNVVQAFEVARQMGILTIGLTGDKGGQMEPLSDILIAVPHGQTNHIQEAHIAVGHLICAIVEKTLCSPKP